MIADHMPGASVSGYMRRSGPAAIRDLLETYGFSDIL